MGHDDLVSPLTPDGAERLAARLLGERRTKLGGLHIDHARRVAERAGAADPRITIVALLHDVIEKTDVTPDALRELVGDPWIADAVDALTQRDGEPDHVYLARCAADPVICHLKRLDLVDKLDSDDVQVPADVADRLRRQAQGRLRTLERYAAAHHP